jgi:YhcN/YlaJ family sporulation lipoprotein
MERKYNTVLSIFMALFIGSVILFGCAKSNNNTKDNSGEQGQSSENGTTQKDSNSDSILLGKMISQGLKDIEGIEKATVFIKESTALVGVAMKDGAVEITDDLRKKIEEKVKEISPKIKKVAITADKELLENLDEMTNDFMNGKTLEELKKDLSEIMDKLGS